MARQLTFDLPVRTAHGRDDFFVSSANAAAVARLDDLASWPNGRLILVGEEGAGKSHLAHVWAAEQDACRLDLQSLATTDVPGIDRPVLVDDLGDGSGLTPAVQEALFHLCNHTSLSRLPLLLVARRPPARFALSLPDLQSRLVASDIVRIEQPDDALLSAVLVKLFADRQLTIAPDLVPWLITQTERSFAAILRFVAALDAAALTEKRNINRQLARRVLDNMADGTR
jgi:chromosomal replication initiation ATPase DnaA